MTDRLAHAFIIASPDERAREARLAEISAALICEAEDRPCGTCGHCRKAVAGLHPDIVRLARERDEKGRARREIYVDQIRELVSDTYVAPNEASRRVFVIEDAHTMNTSAQNALLKVLEEPPGNAAFILLAERADALLPTIRSRCAELAATAGEKAYSEESRSLARSWARLALDGSDAELLRFCAANEGMDTDSLREFLECAKLELFAFIRGGEGRREMELISIAERAELYAQRNVGTKHIFGLLSAARL